MPRNIFTPDMTARLIDLCGGDDGVEATKSKCANAEAQQKMWEETASLLRGEFDDNRIDASRTKKKWDNMCGTYRKERSNVERSGAAATSWEWYRRMHEAVGKQAKFHMQFGVDSGLKKNALISNSADSIDGSEGSVDDATEDQTDSFSLDGDSEFDEFKYISADGKYTIPGAESTDKKPAAKSKKTNAVAGGSTTGKKATGKRSADQRGIKFGLVYSNKKPPRGTKTDIYKAMMSEQKKAEDRQQDLATFQSNSLQMLERMEKSMQDSNEQKRLFQDRMMNTLESFVKIFADANKNTQK